MRKNINNLKIKSRVVRIFTLRVNFQTKTTQTSRVSSTTLARS